MDNAFINMTRKLYELRGKAEQINQNNDVLETKIGENEENIVYLMLACTELYETLLLGVEVYDYGKDSVVKMASMMAQIYANLVKRGLKTLDEVPDKLRAEVEALLGGE